MNIEYLWIALFAITLIFIEVDVILFIRYRKNKSSDSVKVAKINDATERLKIYSEYDFDKIDSRIDKYINEAGQTYKINNFEYRDQEELYLNQEDMEKMIKEMTNDVMSRITPAVLSLIELSYNINSNEDLIKLICEKIKVYVLSYSLETNAIIDDKAIE